MTGNKKWLHLDWFGHHPLNRCCFKSRENFYLQYRASTDKSSKYTTKKERKKETNKQTNKQ
jgi:hypothetical protein